MTPFDPLKALREELAGLRVIQAAIQTRERKVEAELGEAETELSALRKLSGFARELADARMEKLKMLEQEANA